MSELQSAGASTRRKKPPTFQHLPLHRAKTLKKAWVEKTKIKSKWKSEKRKEGIVSSSKLDIPVYEDDESRGSGNNTGNKPKSGDEELGRTQVALPRTARKPTAQAPHIHPSRAHIHPDLPVKQPISMEQKGDADSTPVKKRKRSEAEPAEPVSLRELTREAYSQSTLHTFKSDPLKKKRLNADRGRGGLGGNRGRGLSRTGGGQPNMKLRMNAMLAKIKQDFA